MVTLVPLGMPDIEKKQEKNMQYSIVNVTMEGLVINKQIMKKCWCIFNEVRTERDYVFTSSFALNLSSPFNSESNSQLWSTFGLSNTLTQIRTSVR